MEYDQGTSNAQHDVRHVVLCLGVCIYIRGYMVKWVMVIGIGVFLLFANIFCVIFFIYFLFICFQRFSILRYFLYYYLFYYYLTIFAHIYVY